MCLGVGVCHTVNFEFYIAKLISRIISSFLKNGLNNIKTLKGIKFDISFLSFFLIYLPIFYYYFLFIFFVFDFFVFFCFLENLFCVSASLFTVHAFRYDKSGASRKRSIIHKTVA